MVAAFVDDGDQPEER